MNQSRLSTFCSALLNRPLHTDHKQPASPSLNVSISNLIGLMHQNASWDVLLAVLCPLWSNDQGPKHHPYHQPSSATQQRRFSTGAGVGWKSSFTPDWSLTEPGRSSGLGVWRVSGLCEEDDGGRLGWFDEASYVGGGDITPRSRADIMTRESASPPPNLTLSLRAGQLIEFRSRIWLQRQTTTKLT